jgi:hypothetical protein
LPSSTTKAVTETAIEQAKTAFNNYEGYDRHRRFDSAPARHRLWLGRARQGAGSITAIVHDAK